ncbi:MAG TPA: hypothetical protein ENH02_05760, partial [Bacteroidetes bacterium]|nr:hypothetical protein [Bacteroidota bacterium]
MNRNKRHISSNPDNGDFFDKVTIPYQKNKEEVWAALSSRLEEPYKPKTIHLFSYRPAMAIAAALLALVALFSVMRFYTTN